MSRSRFYPRSHTPARTRQARQAHLEFALWRVLVLSALVSLCSTAWAVSPVELQRSLVAGEKLTVIDVRASSQFQESHIPNAINIPAGLVPQKQLPPLGRVIVYDGGLGQELASAASAALNQKPGISSEVLLGGFAAWESAQVPTTASRGMTREQTPMISYDLLKKLNPGEVLLVDLRKPAALSPSKSVVQSPAPPLTDLQAEFPGVRVSHSPFEAAGPSKTALSTPPLLVLIDCNDGSAQSMARTLKANGIKRFVVLAGGEDIIARKGQSGLERAPGTMSLPKGSVSNSKITQ